MLFITNRAINEVKESPKNGERRTISFKTNDNEPQSSVYFCERAGKERYEEIGSRALLEQLRTDKVKQILLYIHGFNNQPEEHIFPRATALQTLCDKIETDLLRVVSLIWPCDTDLGIIKDYWDDQESADQSAFAFARVLGKFLAWRAKQGEAQGCLKRINIIAHSMGNRVLRLTLERWGKYYGTVPLVFRNIFMAAADVANETLEAREPGQFIPRASRNVVVYHANDDLALRASKVSNVKNKVVSRRLGHSGPEDMRKVPNNVYAIDCDDFNNSCDRPSGHAYFLATKDNGTTPGPVLKHLVHAMRTGRIDAKSDRTLILPNRNYRPKPYGTREES